jgi:thiamine-monophosphate kinase
MAEAGEDEFAVIARLFAPLATDPAARGLLDDVALLRAQGDLAVTADAIIENVHFLPDDPIGSIARKALRVNLSDLAGKGARPLYYLVTLLWPRTRGSADLEAFAAGLAADQAAFGVSLLGGDTTATEGPLAIAVTMLGAAGATTPTRSGAAVGDDVWVSGTIGDGGLGLRALRGESFDENDREFLIDRYRAPQPRLALAPVITTHARASMDVSDGLVIDAGKIAAASGVAIEIGARRIPFSAAAARWLQRGVLADGVAELASAGDDYELLFTAPRACAEDIDLAAHHAGVPATRIGRVVAGSGVRLILDGAEIPVAHRGHVHRLGGNHS